VDLECMQKFARTMREIYETKRICVIAINDKTRTTVFDLPEILYSESLNSGNSRVNKDSRKVNLIPGKRR